MTVPTSLTRNLIYRAALPVMAPSPRGQMHHEFEGELHDLRGYERLLCRHHVLGASLLLSDGAQTVRVETSVEHPAHAAQSDTLYRVASITKMATALTVLSLVADGAFTLDTELRKLLPQAEEKLSGVTVRQLLSHTSGLCDVPEADKALAEGRTWHDVLAAENILQGKPGAQFRYCNFGFGLLGCLLEQLTGQPLPEIYRERLFVPLGMRATLDASTLEEKRIMPITRVLRYHPGQEVTITPLGRKPLTAADPERHFGHSAGAMYTDAPSLQRLLSLVMQDGAWEGKQLLPEALIREMKTKQATYGKLSPGMDYGLGLVLLRDPKLPEHRILGHQGYAYGCADGAFYEEDAGRTVILLNGGCSEARSGRLGLCNRDILRWALGKEIPSWQ